MVKSIIFHICATMHCDIISMTDNVLIPLFIKNTWYVAVIRGGKINLLLVKERHLNKSQLLVKNSN